MNWNGLICNLIDQSKKNKKIILTNGSKVSADFLHVDDASKIILATIKNDVSDVINGASGTETTVLKLAEIIKQLSAENIEIQNIETDNFKEDRAVVNVDKLSKIIDVNGFVNLNHGINEMMKL